MTISGADAGLTALLTDLYKATGGQGAATLGTWRGAKVATVTVGDDVTLAADSGSGWKVAGGWWPSLGKPDPDLGGGPQFLLALGSDARPGEPPYQMRSDVIQILGIDGQGGGGVMGLARDLWAPMPHGGEAKINAAMTQAGLPGALSAIANLTGLPLSVGAVTTFTGLTAMVDAWGGIPVLVDQPVRTSGTSVPAGFQVLNGPQALAFSRDRKGLPDGDFGRSRHQGDLLLAAAVKARTQGVGSIPAVLSIVDQHVETNLPADQALRFGAAFFRLDPTKVGRHVCKGPFGWSADGQSIVFLGDESKAKLAEFASGRLT